MVDIFNDYKGEMIKLAADVWNDHILIDHPEMTKGLIAKVLSNPAVICKSQHEAMGSSIQYYLGPWKNKADKDRFYRVVVKNCSDGIWISTAHTRAKVNCGNVLFGEGKK